MKTPEEVVADIERRLADTWADVLTGSDTAKWPHSFPLGQHSGSELREGFGAVPAAVLRWREWATETGLVVRFGTRRVHGTEQELPTHVAVADIDAAATVCGGDWPQRLDRARQRHEILRERYRHAAVKSSVVRAVEALSDLDFDLLCRAADWFAVNDASGLTPRQVPIEGMHAKWLNTRTALVRELAGVPDLGLLPPHPARIHFTYLDPQYRAGGGRIHDSATVGDRTALPYQPRIVIISENKDTAIHMPAIPGAVSVEGVGNGGSTVASFDWICSAEHVLYWGDMDVYGLEILDGFRAAGVRARSLLMNLAAYCDWERFGTNTDAKGRPLRPTVPREVPNLTADERALYLQLADPACTGHRRVEQERIPLAHAREEILLVTAGRRDTSQ